MTSLDYIVNINDPAQRLQNLKNHLDRLNALKAELSQKVDDYGKQIGIFRSRIGAMTAEVNSCRRLVRRGCFHLNACMHGTMLHTQIEHYRRQFDYFTNAQQNASHQYMGAQELSGDVEIEIALLERSTSYAQEPHQ